MEAHKSVFLCIVKLSFYVFFVHVCRYSIIDIQQCYSILTYNRSDKLAQSSVNIHLAGYWNSFCGQTAVDIAWYKSELGLKCRPAFSCNRNVFSVSFMLLDPIFQSNFILGQLCENLRLFVACCQFRLHFLYNTRNSFVSGMLVVRLE